MSKLKALTKRTRKLTQINANLQNQNLHTELHSVAQQIRESARKFTPKNARISRPVSPFGQGWGIWCVTEFKKLRFLHRSMLDVLARQSRNKCRMAVKLLVRVPW